MNKKILIGIVSLIIAVIILISLNILPFAISNPQLTSPIWGVCPAWGRLECGHISEIQKEESITIPESGAIIPCNEFTDKCDYFVDTSEPVWWSGQIAIDVVNCDANSCIEKANTKYFSEGTSNNELFYALPKGRRLQIKAYHTIAGIKTTPTKIDVTKKYFVWGIYDYYGGAKSQITEGNCNLNSYMYKDNLPLLAYNQIINTNGQPILQMSGGLGRQYVNYVSSWNFCPPTNVFKHPIHGEVYCEGTGNIYKIRKITMASNTVLKLSDKNNFMVSSNVADANVNSYFTPADPLPKEACCPNQALPNGNTCDNNFKIVQGTPECTVSTQCSNGGAEYGCPDDGTKKCQEQCVNNQCVEKRTSVECTGYAQCQQKYGNDYYCNPISFTCQKEQGGEFSTCGNAVCESGENTDNCCKDCGGCIPKPDYCELTCEQKYTNDFIGKTFCNLNCEIPYTTYIIVVLLALIIGMIIYKVRKL